mmetsp:Transcript_2837/g.8100  ORF Transcript_2837/g.8100 Transcript_2837/m.8100 type:complete len:394 (-) Transcript_2837:277-1458(-)
MGALMAHLDNFCSMLASLLRCRRQTLNFVRAEASSESSASPCSPPRQHAGESHSKHRNTSAPSAAAFSRQAAAGDVGTSRSPPPPPAFDAFFFDLFLMAAGSSALRAGRCTTRLRCGCKTSLSFASGSSASPAPTLPPAEAAASLASSSLPPAHGRSHLTPRAKPAGASLAARADSAPPPPAPSVAAVSALTSLGMERTLCAFAKRLACFRLCRRSAAEMRPTLPSPISSRLGDASRTPPPTMRTHETSKSSELDENSPRRSLAPRTPAAFPGMRGGAGGGSRPSNIGTPTPSLPPSAATIVSAAEASFGEHGGTGGGGGGAELGAGVACTSNRLLAGNVLTARSSSQRTCTSSSSSCSELCAAACKAAATASSPVRLPRRAAHCTTAGYQPS